jgi:integrase
MTISTLCSGHAPLAKPGTVAPAMTAERMKAKLEHVVPLSPAARAIIDDIPELGPYVFTLNGRGPFNNFRNDKERLDGASGVTGWRLHDLRRTARSLMSGAGVAPDIAERCLAHTIGSVRGSAAIVVYRSCQPVIFVAW